MAGEEGDIRSRLSGWLGLSRPPFHTFGVLPFFLGTLLAWRTGCRVNMLALVLSILGIALIILSACHMGEHFAVNRGSRCLPNSIPVTAPGSTSPRIPPLRAAVLVIALAGLTGLVLQFGLGTGPLTLLLGCAGAAPAFFYATGFARLVGNGAGECLISACYSWPPLAAGYYLQCGEITSGIHWMGLVTGLATLNVILVNEYPLHPADPMADRKSLLARTGKNGGRLLYILCSILGWICLYLSLRAGIPGKAFYLYLPVMALSAVACFLMARRKYENHFVLEWIGGLTIAVYLGTAAAFLLAFF